MLSTNQFSSEKYFSEETLMDVFKKHLNHFPNKTLYRFFENGEEETDSRTFLELYNRAEIIATNILEHVKPGDRVLLLFPSGLDFTDAFFACLLAGVIAVPAFPPKGKRRIGRLEKIAFDCAANLILTTETTYVKTNKWFNNEVFNDVKWLRTDKIENKKSNQLPKITSNTIAFLQYTSGSTGDPKGVIVSHSNIIHNNTLIKNAFHHTQKTIGLSWLPIYHDMGLIGNILQAFFVGFEILIMPPTAFIQKPLRWLSLIAKNKVTYSGGPNFAFDLCINHIKEEVVESLDLSSWRTAYNGSEPIRPETMNRFASHFSNAGITKVSLFPCYGMAETTLVVSCSKYNNPPIVLQLEKEKLYNGKIKPFEEGKDELGKIEFVGNGPVLGDLKVKIVNPETKQLCKNGEVGEIWISGPSVAKGYWKREKLTEEIFNAQIIYANGKVNTKLGSFLRTGDMGFLENNELYLSGRLKEMMIINGVNHFPQDIEQTVQYSNSDLQSNAGVALSTEINGKQELIIVQEIKRTSMRNYDLDRIVRDVCNAVFVEHELSVYSILLVIPGRVGKTSSGKIQRVGTKLAFEKGEIEGILSEWTAGTKREKEKKVLKPDMEFQTNKSSSEIEKWILNIINKELQINTSQVNASTSFAELGMTSLKGIQLSGMLSEYLNTEVSPTLIYDYPTIKEFATHLSQEKVSSNKETENEINKNESVAIISIACKLPGANSVEEFWENLKAGKDAITEVPEDRWNTDEYFSEEADGTNMNTRWGGFIDKVDEFDASFFGISPREAKFMDPQQRILLELSHELIERSGYKPSDFKGSKTGVYIGAEQVDYDSYLNNKEADVYSGTGISTSILSNRLSYYYDLRGPSMSIGTACSSALVSLHTAVKDIRNGDCTMAIAGGVNLILSPQITIALSQANMMSVDGRCKTFDDSANGYVRSEGAGLVLLKPLSKALEDGDIIEAVIKGSAINQDGRSNGLTAPNGLSQQDLIKDALRSAGFNPNDIDYVEAHGTGTALGDPIEVNALNAVYGEGRSKASPLIVGSVKANIGHLESGAGIAGLIKAVLCLKYGKIPKQIHYNVPNTHVAWERLNVLIPERLLDWDKKGTITRKAGVSSFGFGGANAHTILEEAPIKSTSRKIEKEARSKELVTISSKTEEGLKAQVEAILHFLHKNSKITLQELSYNLAISKVHFEKRTGFICKDKNDLINKLNAFKTGSFKRIKAHKKAFLFTGQGSQYLKMSGELYKTEPVFKEAFNTCAKILDNYLEKNLLSVIFSDTENDQSLLLNQTNYTQPALFSVGYALAKLWESWGVLPDVLIGHSLGEITAACIAGVFNLDDALKLVAHRGRLMQGIKEQGSMLSVQCTINIAEEVIKGYENSISIAAINSPYQIVLSGESDSINQIKQLLDSLKVKYKDLPVSQAFHSPLMKEILEEFQEIASSISYKLPEYDIVSNVTGKIENEKLTSPDYWTRHISAPVSFKKGMETLESLNTNIFIEIGPNPTLITQGSRCVADSSKGIWLPSMKKGLSDTQVILESLLELYKEGHDIDWNAFFSKRKTSRVVLPTYKFQRKSYWVEDITKKERIKNNNSDIAVYKKEINGSFDEVYKNLVELIASALQIETNELSPQTILLNIGADSLVLTEITKKIEKYYNVGVPIRRLFEDIKDIEALVNFILEKIEIEHPIEEKIEKEENLTSSKIVEETITGKDPTLEALLNQFSEQNRIISEYLNIAKPDTNTTVRKEVKGTTPKRKESKESVALANNVSDTSFFFQKLPKNQEEQLPELIKSYNEKTQGSKDYAQEHRGVLADFFMARGFKMSTKEMEYLIVCDKAAGSRFTDIDGNSYIDITMGYGSSIFGHQPDFIIEAIQKQLHLGITVGPLAKLSGDVANLIAEITGMERVAFANTGTEAVSFAMRLARAATKKNKIIIFSGSYHGHIETVLGIPGDEGVAPMVPGVTNNMVKDLVILSYNDPDIIDQIRAHADDLAGVMVEPVRSRFPDSQPVELLKQMSELTQELDIPLIFDEMITGFRIMPGGAQEYFGIRANIATYGKIAGGGMPLGVIAGSRKYLDVVDGGHWSYGDDSYPKVPKTFVAGTFTRHPLTMAASKAILTRIKNMGKEKYIELNRKTDDLMHRLNKYFQKESLPIEVVNFGSLFRFKFRENFDLLLFHLRQRGIYAWAPNNLYITFAHSDEDLNDIYKAICESTFKVCKPDEVYQPEITISNNEIVTTETTLAQRQLFVLNQMSDELSLSYRLSFSMHIKGNLHVDSLKKAVNHLVNTHQILKSKFSEDGKQLIYDMATTIPVEEIDMSSFAASEVTVKYNEFVESQLRKPFILSESSLVRLYLVKLASNEYSLFSCMHHIISDGWSCAIFSKLLLGHYNAFFKGENIPANTILQFSSYVKWLKKKHYSASWKEHEKYLFDTYSKLPLRVNFPFDEKTPNTNENSSVIVKINADEVKELKQWSAKQGLTLFMTFLSAFEIILLRICRLKEMVIGVPVGGRTMPESEKMIGYFAHFIPLASRYDSNAIVSDYLKKMKSRLFDAYEHQEYPYAEFLNLLQREAKLSTEEFINVVFNFDVSLGNLEIEDAEVSFEEHSPLYNAFDMTFNVIEESDGLLISMNYNSAIISNSFAGKFLDYYRELLKNITKDTSQRIGDLNIVTIQEENVLLGKTITPEGVNFNPKEVDLDNTQPINVCFEQIVSQNKNQIAVIHNGDSWNYEKLNKYANRIAHKLTDLGVKEESCVGVYLERNPKFVGSMLGIIKAGGSYTPLDTQNTPKRIDKMLSENSFSVLITTSALLEELSFITNTKVILIDEVTSELSAIYNKSDINIYDSNDLNKQANTNPVNINRMDSWAYVLFTSGSTGAPKGAITRHDGAMNHVLAEYKLLELSDGFRFLQSAGIGSDISVWQILGPLLKGGTSVIVDKNELLDYESLLKTIKTTNVNVVEFVPTYMWGLLAYIKDSSSPIVLDALEWIMLVGEAIPASLVNDLRDLYPTIRLTNAYGPCEASDDVIQYEIVEDIEEAARVPIGSVIPNMNVAILDENLQLCPIEIPGEICVTGVGVGAGYMNLPEKTAQNFIKNPYQDLLGEVMYKTGDFGRWLPNGNIEFLGREDHQVKIRGHRVELEGISSVIRKSDFVEDAHVLVYKNQQERDMLLCFIVLSNGILDEHTVELSLHELSKDELPSYMHPSQYCIVDEFPVNLSDKVDKKKLIALYEAEFSGKRAIQINRYVAPRNEFEEKTAQIWQELLGIPKVGIHENFFELGGHSLLATSMVAEVRKRTAINLTIRAVFKNPTIESLVGHLNESSDKIILPSITVQENQERIPLSYSQERLWFLDQLQGSLEYHMSGRLEFTGNVTIQHVEKALKIIVDRHQTLKTIVKSEDGIGYQETISAEHWKLSQAIVSNEEEMEKDIAAFSNIPFDLTKDYMLKARIYNIGNKKFTLTLVIHHIASDGWSESILLNEFVSIYSALEKNEEINLSPLALQYSDYTIWQRTYLDDKLLNKQLDYWKSNLTGVSPLALPLDNPRPSVQDISGKRLHFKLDNELKNEVLKLCKREEVTLFMTLLSTFKTLLYRYSGQDDICVGTPIANRTEAGLESIIGCFVNTLALRTDLGEAPSFKELLQRVKETTLHGYDNQLVPFEKVVDCVVETRDMSMSPLFQAVFVLQNTPEALNFSVDGLDISLEENENPKAKFDITLTAEEHDNGIDVSIEYCTALFSEETIKRLFTHFKELLKSVVKNVDTKIAELSMLSKSEENKLLHVFNQPQIAFPKEETIVSLFEKQVEINPQNIAVTFEGETLTYLELDQKSNQVARYLNKKGVIEEELVGICIERSLEMIIGLLGILKAGGTYVPIDPKYPEDRIQYIIEDSEVSFVITSSKSKSVLTTSKDLFKISLDEEWEEITKESPLKSEQVNKPEHSAYIIYTSGSTGKPKGVVLTHQNVVRLFFNENSLFDFNEKDVWTMFHSFCFDFSVWEMYGALLYGGRLVVVPETVAKDITTFKKLLINEGVTILNQTPGAFYTLQEEFLTEEEKHQIRYVIFGGEALNPSYLKPWKISYPSCKLINMYGITETTVHVTYKEITEKEVLDTKSTIGNAIPTLNCYILDDNLQLLPVGAIGEICITGEGLAKGYLRREQLTNEKFVNNPFDTAGVSRLYKSGDLGRWLANGDIEFVGRKDDQVKIRGYRIELGEIQSVLSTHPEVSNCCVLVKKDALDANYLIGYVVANETIKKEELENYLRAKLPDYMVPRIWVKLSEMPLTSNGKIAKKKLPEPDVMSLSAQEYVKPRTLQEHQLAEIWKSLLEIDKVGIHDNFFELGGHSLLATRLVSIIRKEMGIELPIKMIFTHTTIELLSKEIEGQDNTVFVPAIVPQKKSTMIPLSFSQERLWFLDTLQGTEEYHITGGLHLKGAVNFEFLEKAMRYVVDRHEILRTVIKTNDGIGYQEVISSAAWELQKITVETKNEEQEVLKDFISKSFSISEDYMLRACLYDLGNKEYTLVCVFHHIASDGLSIPIFIDEFTKAYQAIRANEKIDLSSLSIQYADYALWQRNYIEGAFLEKQLRYWKEKLEGVTPLSLPTDFARPSVQSIAGNSLYLELDKDLKESLTRKSQEEGVTLFMFMLSAFKILLYKYSKQNDICVGTSIANRTQTEIEKLIGFFVNTLALRSNINNDVSFNELLAEVKETTLEAYNYQLAPFEKVVDHVVNTRDMSITPVFQVMFDLNHEEHQEQISLGDLEITTCDFKEETSQFDLTLVATEHNSGISLRLEYCTELFEEATIERMLIHYNELLKNIVNDSSKNIADLKIITSYEEDILLGKVTNAEGINFNPKEVNLNNDRPINIHFENIVDSNETSTAVIHNNIAWTYRELNSYSNQIAHQLFDLGIKEENCVGVYLDRSVQFVGCMLGIIKSGGVYTPLDTQNPASRVENMMSENSFEVLITTASLLKELDAISVTKVIVIDEVPKKLVTQWKRKGIQVYDSTSIEGQKVTNPENNNRMDSWAYVLFTSGSTGTPKGAITRHDGAMNHLLAEYKLLNLPDGFRFLQSAGIGSDISVWQILGPLLKGGTCVIVDKYELLDYESLLTTIARNQVTIVEFVPTYMWGLVSYIKETKETIPLNLDWIMLVGEAIPTELVNDLRRLYPAIKLLNAYGPCEASDDVIQYEITDNLSENKLRVPIGKVIPNMNVAILDEDLQLCPIGVAGELCVSGVGVGAGYIGLPERTVQSFIPNPFPDLVGEVLYKTGDMGRWLPDGNIEFLGREDHQVKIKGHRVELEGIASVLRKPEEIEDSHIIVYKDDEGNDSLICFVVLSTEGENADNARINELLFDKCQAELPAYMYPSQYCIVKEFPQNLSDKVDIKALIALYETTFLGDKSSTKDTYVAPENELEKKLVEIWQNLLNVSKIGVYDNFFELGGDSIITIQVVSRVKKAGYHLKPRDIFNHQTISELSKVVSEAVNISQGEQGILEGESPLLPIQQIYFEEEYSENEAYNQSVLLAIDKSVNSEYVKEALDLLVRHHDALRFKYENIKGEWIQTFSEVNESLEIVDLTNNPISELSESITEICKFYQHNLSIFKGEVFKTVLIKTPEKEAKDRLFIVAHHLVIDGISWRILLTDLARIVNNLNSGEPVDLGVKGNSYREWVLGLQEYTTKKIIASQVTYWSEIGNAYQPLITDKKAVVNKIYADILEYEMVLDVENTSLLLQDVHNTYGTDINDILLSCLALTISKWANHENVIIGLEGHGREEISEHIDVNSTIGWFTSLYPVCLSVKEKASLGEIVTSTKENLRRIPNKGIGYGILKYLHPSQEIKEQLSTVKWDIIFNYLGQFDNVLDTDSWLSEADEFQGNEIGASTPFNHKLEINGSVTGGELKLVWSYSTQEYNSDTISELAKQYLQNLKELITHCKEKENRIFTPSDYGLENDIKHEELDEFLNTTSESSDLEELFKI